MTPEPQSAIRPLSAPAVSLHAGRLAFGGAVLFDDLDMTLEGGRFTVLLGPSGVGKSSLLRLIAGLERRADDAVRCSDGAPLRGRVAWMAQDDQLLPWLSVLDNVLLGPWLRGRPEEADRRKAKGLLADVGLAEAAGARPDALSGGMRQRAALARTLMEDRAVVLMDEPFSALDAVTRLRLQDLAGRLLAGRTVLLVTHDPLEALRLGDRVHVLSGRPARLDDALLPPGAPPRAAGDASLLALQADLLDRLARAAESDGGAA